jgi:F-type H+-transporting ATPase subunit b
MENIGIEPRQLLMQLINFLIMVVVLTKLLYKPIIKMLDERKKKIEDALKDAEKVSLESEKSDKKRLEIISKAKVEAKEIIGEAKITAKKTEEEILSKAHAEAQSILEKGKKELESERENMEKELKKQTVDIAAAIAEKAIGQILSSDNQKSIIEKKIRDLYKTV